MDAFSRPILTHTVPVRSYLTLSQLSTVTYKNKFNKFWNDTKHRDGSRASLICSEYRMTSFEW